MKTHSPADFFVFRTPILPWDVVLDWSTGLREKGALTSDQDLEAALAADEALLRARLREIARQPAIREALFVASPSLDSRVDKWLSGDTSEASKGVELVVARYLMRMAGRATPFGLFAATGVGNVGRSTDLAVPDRAECRRHTRLDMDYVFRLTEALSANPEIRSQLRFTANESEYDVNGRLRYIQTRAGAKRRTYHLVDVDRTPYLAVALAAARRPGGATLQELAQAIVGEFPAVTPEAAAHYVHDLIASHLVCSPLAPKVTGDEPVATLVRALEDVPTAAAAATSGTLSTVLKNLEALDASGFGASASAYEEVADLLRPLPVELDISRLFQVDLHWPSRSATLGQALVDEVGRGAELLHAIGGRISTPLQSFARAFDQRYGWREVPLLEALDEESGIGFEKSPGGVDPSPILDDVPIYARPLPGSWRDRDRLLLKKVQTAALTGAMEIALTDADIEVLSAEEPRPLGAGFSALVEIDAASAADVNRGDYRLFMQQVAGRTAGCLLGRFCHGDPVLAERTRRAIEAEDASDPDAVHAEIAHLPQGRVGNILCRPLLREFEIPIVGGSGAPLDRQIQLGDLLLSIHRGQLRLRSKRLGRRVVVHLSSAHNVLAGGLAVYRFLAQLHQDHNAPGAGWQWGPLESAPFLPRVVRGRHVLSRAQWTIEGEDLGRLTKASGVVRWRLLEDTRRRLRLPRFVRFADGDNTLPVDLESVTSLESLFSTLSQRDKIVLTEFPSAEHRVASGSGGGFHHELVIPYVPKVPAAQLVPKPADQSTRPLAPSPDRGRRPGDDWLYLKIYGGTVALDRVLQECVAPVARELRAEGLVSRWFFIRYSDPDFHLRVRFQGGPTVIAREVAPRVYAALEKVRGITHKIAQDTYDQEIERYGGEAAMAIAEQMFEADSDAAIDVLATFRNDRNARWRTCLLGMNALLLDMDFPFETLQTLMTTARDGQMAHYEQSVKTTKAIGDKYRKLRPEIEALLERTPEQYSKAVAAIQRRSAALAGPLARLRDMESRRQLTQKRTWLAINHLHMWANRMCRASANPQELVMYDFLARHYEGKVARARRLKKAG